MNTILLGITGTDGAGKGTLVEYLVQEEGFVHYAARARLEEILRERGVEATRANLRLLGNELRTLEGDDYLVRYYCEKIKADGTKRAVIESIRSLAEAETLKNNGGILIAVDADQAIRYARVQARRSASDQVTFEQFVAHEALEMNDPDPHGMQKQRVMAIADYTIENNTNREELYTALKEILKQVL